MIEKIRPALLGLFFANIILTSSCFDALFVKKDAPQEILPEDPELIYVDDSNAIFDQASFGEIKSRIGSIRSEIQYIKKNVVIANQKYVVIKNRLAGLEGQSPAIQETIKLYDILQNQGMVEENKLQLTTNDQNIKYHQDLMEYYRLNKDFEISKLRVKHAELALNIVELQRSLLKELESAFALTPEDIKYLTDSSQSYDPGYMDVEVSEADKKSREVTCREMSHIFAIDVCAILGQYDRIVSLADKRREYLKTKQEGMMNIRTNLSNSQNKLVQAGQPFEVF
ncbi:MAG: hypothetical protein OEZ13_00190 [Spirochaetia bacterium]|nr:hypothetical protein [Spirochaetia bacterium]